MIYFITALHPEAKPLIDKYNLKKTDDGKFQIYKNESIILIITGTGQTNAAIAVTYLLTKYNCTNYDFVINIGVCAGLKEAGNAYFINKITDITTARTYYPDVFYNHSFDESEIYSGSQILSDGSYPLYDMEAASIYQSAIKFVSTDRIAFIKIISDNFSPNITGEILSEIIYAKIPLINDYISSCLEICSIDSNPLISNDLLRIFDRLKAEFHCSVTMENNLKGFLRYAFVTSIDTDNIIKEMYANDIIPCKTKEEGKKALEIFKQKLL